jgi:hypothetical protein
VELATEIGISPSFPVPPVLVTRIATRESFGIIPVPHALAQELGFQPSQISNNDFSMLPIYHGSPVHLLT